ncbi:MAG: hypothetical protein RL088_1107 [Verrucomicrobiota bacterium]|jgi:mono/diheme cytochrome c family protein
MFIIDAAMHIRSSRSISLPLLAVISTACTGDSAHGAPDFIRDVLPIFEKHCTECHGKKKQKSGYRLDIRENALKGGDSGQAAIIPHSAATSPLIHLINGDDPEMIMPPPKSGKERLSAAEVSTLRAWIDAGPSWPDEFAGKQSAQEHWSLKPLVKPSLPASGGNPIDAFIRESLARNGLTASPQADRRTLIRRAYFDLIGLPPSPEEVRAFSDDTEPAAYERMIDRLLSSPRHGERWARHWFDTIHFADSHGYEHDIARDNAWRFRDYVIDALNRDTPWPRFIREQLAADFFFPEETSLTPALGFLGAGTFDLSAFGTAPVTFDYIDRDDMVTQTMAAFTSTTANCARCHAHKFDPISQEDYYALQAVFAGILKGDVTFDASPETARERRRWETILAAAEKRDAAVLLAAEHQPVVEKWLVEHPAGAAWKPLEAETFTSAEGATLVRQAEGFILASGTAPERDTYTITASPGAQSPCITALRLDLYPHDSLPMRGPGRCGNGNLHLSEIEVRVFESGTAEGRPVKIASATADFNQTDWGVHRAIDGDSKTAWGIHPEVGKPHHAVFTLAEPLPLKADSRLAVTLKQAHGGVHLIGAFSLSTTDAPPKQAVARPVELELALRTGASARTPEQRITIATHALHDAASDALAKLPPPETVYAVGKTVKVPNGESASKPFSIPEPKTVNVLLRGDFDKPRAVATPGALSAMKHLPARFELADPKSEAARRAALADWIAHPDNVLTWRSIVNRVWHYHFGRGLCDTPSDFGRMGGTPSHPELLDWLAVWFRDDAKGSLKALHRLIVTSEAFRQSSAHRADMAALDAGNRFLWRQNRHRLDADAFRDFTLAASGALDLTMGGPGVRFFTASKGPQGTPSLDYSAFDLKSAGAGRRSVYRFVWRSIADPLMESLDFPDLGILAPSRSFSVSGLQALTLYNNRFVLHHSELMARRCGNETDPLPARITNLVRIAWNRDPDSSEIAEFTAFASSRGLESLCRVLLNSNEFLFIN